MIRVLLLDPDLWRHRGVACVMTDSGMIEVIGETDYGKILSLTRAPDDLKPDVVALAHRLVMEYGVAIIAVLRDLFDPCSVLVYGDVESLEVTAQVFAAGARGYFVLSHPPGLLPKAIGIVSTGKFWGPREAVARMADRILESKDEEGEYSAMSVDGDERRLLLLLNEGLSNKEIGQRLGLAEATIKARFNRLYKRFGVSTRLQLLTTAIREGIVVPSQTTSV
ncbi:MAG TPA: LuxR C-terminal-related transcriptional regulator [Thermoanaerobaculia bacterium]|nr:LuxR C-terminal-related transcriptional regulator [Thermoanaerobaculia bacterium]